MSCTSSSGMRFTGIGTLVPAGTSAAGSTMDRTRYSRSTVTVSPLSSVTCEPYRPFQVGPTPAAPSVVWHAMQP